VLGDGWREIRKTVYSIYVKNKYIYAQPNDRADTIGLLWTMGTQISVIATNGTWYKVEMKHAYGSAVGYVKCAHTTDRWEDVHFTKIPEEHGVIFGTVKDGKSGAYLSEIGFDRTSSVFIPYAMTAGDDGYVFQIEAVNDSGTWARVHYYGYDSKGKLIDGKKTYYCSTEYLDMTEYDDWKAGQELAEEDGLI
jgi:hypothetical protein